MPYTANDWPIAAALLQFPGAAADGSHANDAEPTEWFRVFSEVSSAGFDHVDLTDSWVRPGDLTPSRLAELAAAAAEAGLTVPSISAIRRSVIDAHDGDENLAYSHRSIDAAAALGAGVLSVGLHQPLTPQQKQRLWFWTETGHIDDPADPELFHRAASRLRELGEHAQSVGVLLSLEMYEDTYLGTAASSVRLVEEIGLDTVGLNPDLGNLIRLHRPIEDWRELAEATMPYANFWHVKNYLRDEDPATGTISTHPASLENGLMNYRELVEIALASGFAGAICAEHYGGDGLSVSASNRDYLRRHALPKKPGYPVGRSRVRQIDVRPASPATITAPIERTA